MPSVVITTAWQDLDIDDAKEAWESFRERLRREMRSNQECAKQCRKDAADELEQAQLHDERAAELWQLINAMNRAPITWPSEPNGDPKC